MQLEPELRWYTDQLGKLEDLVSPEILSRCGCIVVVSTTPTLLLYLK